MKVRDILSEAKEISTHGWEKSKWWPKKHDPDLSPTKIAFGAMVNDAVKHWPQSIRNYLIHEGVGVGGNSVFDSIQGFMHEFEDAEYDYDGIPLDNFYDDIVKFGKKLEEYHSDMKALQAKIEATTHNRRIKTYDDYKAAVAKIKPLGTTLFTNGGEVHVSMMAWDLPVVAMKIREAEWDFKLKKAIPGEDKQYMPRNATEEFKFDPETAMLRLFNVILHLVGWTDILALGEPPSIDFKREPMETLLQADEFIDWNN